MKCLLKFNIHFARQAFKRRTHYEKCMLKVNICFARQALKAQIVMKRLLKFNIRFARQALKRQTHYDMPAKIQYSLCSSSLEMPKSLWNACYKSIFALLAKPRNAKTTVKFLLKVNVCSARQAWKSPNHYETSTNKLLCFARQALKRQNHYELPVGNKYSLCLPSVETPKPI